jgi:hypothetical protein
MTNKVKTCIDALGTLIIEGFYSNYEGKDINDMRRGEVRCNFQDGVRLSLLYLRASDFDMRITLYRFDSRNFKSNI